MAQKPANPAPASLDRQHAFTFVGADIPEQGIKYNEKAHRRSEGATMIFSRRF